MGAVSHILAKSHVLWNLEVDRTKAVDRSLVKSQSCGLSIDVQIVSQLKCQCLGRQVVQGFRCSESGFPMDYGWAAKVLSWNHHHNQNLIQVATIPPGRENAQRIFAPLDPENVTSGDQVAAQDQAPHYPMTGTLVASDACRWRQPQCIQNRVQPKVSMH